MRRWLGLWVAVVLAGCDSTPSYFPIEVNSVATFRVRGFRTQITMLRLQRILSVAGARGVEVAGPNGVSRVAWSNGELRAQQLVNARFEPDIPLLSPANLKDTENWKGTVAFLESKAPATATLTQTASTEDYQGRHLQVINAVLTVNLAGPSPKVIELDSTYAKGLGLVHQEQRTDGHFDLELMRL
jgi:hypothetical protein